ncbi:tetratricopeptide repeat-containing diguanylate cyclase [Undibacterium aquatile]|uniref:diguanylate cyclase n=1 Tax=Undibacterium aquatile TaxID=1537398 RepID=A0ABR6XGI0_9BURK|nr:GGDEF domain-containing protein [Undibacterium aquatile]MBC3812019.1 diguanylate cyclase [Undibacterium aquatile]
MRLLLLCAMLLIVILPREVNAATDAKNDVLFQKVRQTLSTSPDASLKILDELASQQTTFSTEQKNKFLLLRASALGFLGKHRERVQFVQSVISDISDIDYRARFLYQLSDGYINLGEYENALSYMNQSIVLLPSLKNKNAKIDVFQSAIVILNSLRAYDESMMYALRLSELDREESPGLATCLGIGDQIEISFLKGNRQKANELLNSAIKSCDEQQFFIMSLLIKTIANIDVIESGNYALGIKAGVSLAVELKKSNQSSDYLIQLETALAKAYLKTGDTQQAESYGVQAYTRAKKENVVLLLEKASEIMADIKRSQGQYFSALEYADTALTLKNKLLDQQLQKNLAYQRVKFEIQDKANQMVLLEQKNKILDVEKKLEKKSNQNLLLIIALVLCFICVLGVWLWKVIRQKNIFQRHAELDGLTQISNRSHFMSSAEAGVKHRTAAVSLILFDMDFFKNVNDSFGHPTGDWVLKNVSQAVAGVLRKGDVFGRIGGEEFAIFLPAAEPEIGLQLAERCRHAITMIDTESRGIRFPLSASFGLATMTMNTSGITNFQELMQATDKALYQSKADGRNRVSVFS